MRNIKFLFLLLFVIILNSNISEIIEKTEIGNRIVNEEEYRGWKYIVIHHSATDSGSLAAFHNYQKRKGSGGVAYHFVIGNGNGSEDGKSEESFRWKEGLPGAHVSINSWEYNLYGIGICLVGNFNDHPPTNAQYESLIYLITHLVKEYKIPPERIVGHKDVPFDHDPSQHEGTQCPGKYLHIQDVKERVIERTLSDTSGMYSRYMKIRIELRG